MSRKNVAFFLLALLLAVAELPSARASDNDSGPASNFNPSAFGAAHAHAPNANQHISPETAGDPTLASQTGGGGYEVVANLPGGGGMDVGALRVNTALGGGLPAGSVPVAAGPLLKTP